MMNKKQNRRSGSGKNVKDENLIAYRGPVRLKNTLNQVRTERQNFGSAGQLLASGSGILDVSLGSTTLVQNAGDWANIAACFNEFRVLAMEIICSPVIIYGSTTIVTKGLYTVVDHDVSSTLGSASVASNHESCRLKWVGKPFSMTAKMSGLEEGVWLPTSSTTSFMWLKFYSTGFAANQVVADYQTLGLVEFRGRK
jgi:hypothetical protein